MAFLLTLDTATEKATVLLQHNEQLLAFRQNEAPMQHAAFIQPAIAAVCAEAGVELSQLNGVIVVNGPGSYTGLRVGLSTAKGICFAMGLPLYQLNTLTIMAAASIRVWKASGGAVAPDTVFCPMIDARRMEVFTAMFSATLEPIIPPCALILDTEEAKNIIKKKKYHIFRTRFEKIADDRFTGGSGNLRPNLFSIRYLQIRIAGMENRFRNRFSLPGTHIYKRILQYIFQ